MPSLYSLIGTAVSKVDVSLLHPSQARRRRRHPLQGFCYVIAEALWHLGFREAGYVPMRVMHEGQSHWFLRHPEGPTVDPTAGQFRKDVPYRKAKRAGFLTRKPSSRALTLMARMS